MAKRRKKTDRGTREALGKMKYEAAGENAAGSGIGKEPPAKKPIDGEIVRRMIYEQLRQMQKEQPGDRK